MTNSLSSRTWWEEEFVLYHSLSTRQKEEGRHCVLLGIFYRRSPGLLCTSACRGKQPISWVLHLPPTAQTQKLGLVAIRDYWMVRQGSAPFAYSLL